LRNRFAGEIQMKMKFGGLAKNNVSCILIQFFTSPEILKFLFGLGVILVNL
jgi:hypothetical protein